MLERLHYLETLSGLLSRHPVVAMIGARQVGKTTLARELLARHEGPGVHFDLEDPTHLARLADPMLALRDLRGLVVLDEVQRLPGLFEVLRVLADRPDCPARFLVLGSASPDLLRQSSETLAGRIAYLEVAGFELTEVGPDRLVDLWIRGGFPRSFLAESDAVSAEWRREFIRTYLERDLPRLGIGIPASTIHRFWKMLAHGHGQLWNASAFGRSFGVADTTVRRYLDMLVGTYVVRLLPPWHANLKKRQVKAPKVYLTDSGLLHGLLGLEARDDVESHPVLGASWEGFGIEQVLRALRARPDEGHFWATHAGAELDLLVVRGNRRLGFEIKRTASPKVTRSMHIALDDLDLERLDVVHAGRETFALAERVRAVAMERLVWDLQPL